MGELEPIEPANELTHLEATLEALEVGGEQYLAEQVPENTKRAYEEDWRVWCQYTAKYGIPDTTNTKGALIGFIAYLEGKELAPNTIIRRFFGAIVGLTQRNVEPTKAAKKAARAAIDGYKTRLAQADQKVGRGKAPAMTMKYIREMVKVCPDTVVGKRDRAIVLVAFSIAARRSEIANLLASDIERTDEGLIVRVRFGKTGGRDPQIPESPGSPTCPVAAWEEWVQAGEIYEGAAFRGIHRSGRILRGLKPNGIGEIITRIAVRAEVPVRLTGHSARAGMATEARKAGHDKMTIADQGGWARNSAALEGYFREVDRWANNPLKGIGL
jgi:integrase